MIKTQTVTAEIAGKYALYAMISSNTYHKKDRILFPVHKLGWILVDVAGKPTNDQTPTETKASGLAYDIYEKEDSDEVIFSFRGTDNYKDSIAANLAVPFSIQYKQAQNAVAKYIKDHPYKKITLTGHSLGGGLALSASVRSGVNSTYGTNAIVFDASPRIFDGRGDHHKDAERILIYQKGEILEKVRKRWKKISEVIKTDNIYMATFDFGTVNEHRVDFLASQLLEFGANANPSLLPVRDAVREDVKDQSFGE